MRVVDCEVFDRDICRHQVQSHAKNTGKQGATSCDLDKRPNSSIHDANALLSDEDAGKAVENPGLCSGFWGKLAIFLPKVLLSNCPARKFEAWAFFMSENNTQMSFAAMDLPADLVKILLELDFHTPTPIQEQAIPIALEEKDIVGIAQTGTGKTLAFGLPLLSNLREGEQGLVLVPTRELALQVEDTFKQLQVKTAVLIGGAAYGNQIKAIRRHPEVIIATPGRLEDHLARRTVSLDSVGIVVLDEADRMFDMGFAPAIKRILGAVTPERQTMLFSATMPPSIMDLAENYLQEPVRIEVTPQGTAAPDIAQELYVVHKEEKNRLLSSLLDVHDGTILVFSRTRHGATKLTTSIRQQGHSAVEIHSDRSLNQRIAALSDFKNGKARILVATDIAARGIDVKNISLVINFDVPEHAEDYVHRIGRTGRAGASGMAITLASPDQLREVVDIEKVMNFEMPVAEASPLPYNRPTFGGRGGGRSRGRSGGGKFTSRGRGPKERSFQRA